MEIREATQDDNEALLELQKKCPMGVDFVVSVDSSPDYFARSKPFQDPHVFVAVENQQIIGSIACAIQNTLIQEKPAKTAYLYGMMVDPAKRRAGIASQLEKHAEDYAKKQKADLCHLLVVEENVPSMQLFQKMGFQPVRDCTLILLQVYKNQKLQNENSIRTMRKTDIDNVVSLINDTYRDYDFYKPFDKESLQEHIKRFPYFNQDDIYVIRTENNTIKACLGHWDRTKTMRDRVQKMNRRLRTISLMTRLLSVFTSMPRIPKLGETIKQWHLFPVACKDASALEELVKHVNNVALKNGVSMLAVTLDPQNALLDILSKFRHVKVKLHYYIKPLKNTELNVLRERKLYIDPADA